MSAKLRPLRDRLSECLNEGRLDEAARMLRDLERLDAETRRARWAQRLGDVERRRGNRHHAATAYARAAGAYRRQGLPQWAEALQRTADQLR